VAAPERRRPRAARWRPPSGFAILALALALAGADARAVAPEDPPILSEGAEPVIALLRSAPDDPARLEAVARWAEERDGVASLADALAARGRARADALDLSLAGTLLERAGRPEDALAPHEEALALRPSLDRSRRALVALLLRGGWTERALELAGDPASIDLGSALRFAAAGAIGGEAGARRRLEASGLPLAERRRLARDAGLFSLAAALAEEEGDLAAAFELRIAAGETERAGELRGRGAEPSAEAGLDFARLTGDRRLFDAALAARTDPAAAELRTALARTLGEVGAGASAGDGAPARTEDAGTAPSSGETLPAPSEASPDPRLEAALALLAGAGEASSRARLAEPGPPSFAVAAAWLAAGEELLARRETVRARLAARPGEERFRARLSRQRPEWFGGDVDPETLIDLLEDVGGDVAGTPPSSALGAPPRPAIDRAILAALPGSSEEAELLFHRHRLFALARDLERAAAIAPAALVEWPLAAGIRAAMPIAAAARTSLDPRAALAAPIALPDPIDRAIGSESGRPLRVGSRSPSRSDWHLVEWREVAPGDPAERVEPPVGLGDPTGPAAPITAWLELGEAGRLLAGRGLEIRAPDGSLVVAWRTPLPLDIAAAPALGAHLPAPLVAFLDELRAEEVSLADFPALAETWRGIVLREGLDPAARPELVRESGAALVLRGGGIRAELRAGERPPEMPREPAEPAEPAPESGTPTDRRTRPEDPGSPPPTAPLAIVRSGIAEPARAGREIVAPFFADEPVGAWTSRTKLSPETIRCVRAGELSLVVDRSGRLEGGDRGTARWRSFLAPPLPGPTGWRFERGAAEAAGRRGPDLTGPSSDGGLLRFHRLAEDRLAIASDRVVICDLDGVLPPPAGPAGGTFARIRDVADGEAGTWVLPAPGDRIAGERETIALGREGGFDIEGTGDAVWVLGYDPVAVGLWLRRIDPAGAREVALPEGIAVEEDRAHQRPVALGRWGDRLLIASHGRVWIETDTGWLDLLPRAPSRRALPASAWQCPPRVAGERLIVAWPWGEIEEARAP